MLGLRQKGYKTKSLNPEQMLFFFLQEIHLKSALMPVFKTLKYFIQIQAPDTCKGKRCSNPIFNMPQYNHQGTKD